jgi:hypothetical protein
MPTPSSSHRASNQAALPPSPGEEGMLSLASIFVLMGILVLFALLANVTRTVDQKMETQNGADAIAYSSALELARGMNGVTATNHLIGELMALVVLHHALGGDELDGLKQVQRTPGDIRDHLRYAYYFASATEEPQPTGYDTVNQEPDVGGTIWDCRMRLKQVLTWAYIAHGIGGLFQDLQWIPFGIGAALEFYGLGLSYAAYAFEWKCYVEWKILDGVEYLAKSIVWLQLKRIVKDVVIPALHHVYARAVVLITPVQAWQMVGGVAAPNAVDGSLYPKLLARWPWRRLHLPVTTEPGTLRYLPRSQLVRASTPWIRYWRIPLLRFGEDWLLLARFKSYYMTRSDQYTLTLCQRMKQDKSINLYIMEDAVPDGADKGHEPWTTAEGSPRADNLFSVVGFAHRPAPPITSYGIFRQGNPDGLVAYAQAMIYNANPQTGRSAGAHNQPVVGWDTLNWDNVVPEFSWDQPREPDPPIPDMAEPRIRLNWQAKLTPTTQLVQAASLETILGGPDAKVLRRTAAFLPLASTH